MQCDDHSVSSYAIKDGDRSFGREGIGHRGSRDTCYWKETGNKRLGGPGTGTANISLPGDVHHDQMFGNNVCNGLLGEGGSRILL